MKQTRYSRLGFLAMLAVYAMALSMAHAQERFPSKPVRLIVPYTAGGPGDRQLRPIAAHAAKRLGQQVLLDYRPGAQTAIGGRLLAQADPDGYTIGMVTVATTMLPAITKTPQPDPVKSFTPITQINYGHFSIVVHSSVPARNVMELVAYAKANPGKFNFGVGGSSLELAVALLGSETNVNWSMIRYKGVAPSRTAVMANEVQAAIDLHGFAKQQADSGRIRIIAVTGPKRSPIIPAVPTVAESGVPGYEAGFWWGLGGPAGLPPAVVATLNDAFVSAIRSPEVDELIRAEGTDPTPSTPQELGRLIGFCGRGEGGPFVAGGATAPGGSLPVNTGGGHLSGYYLQGMTPLSEGILQARGRQGERQCRSDVVLVTNDGGHMEYHGCALLSPHRPA